MNLSERVELEVYSFEDPTVMMDVLNGRVKPSFLEEIRAGGGGTVSVSISDPKVLANPLLLDYRNTVKIRVYGEVVGRYLMGKKKTKLIEGDAAAEVYEMAGEGPRVWFKEAQVLPYGGLQLNSPDSRSFNFSSETGDWFVSGDWVTPTVVANYELVPPKTSVSPWKYAPGEWPDAPTAKWIWSMNSIVSAPAGDNYFRYAFNAPLDAKYSFFLGADDIFTVYVDGQVVASSDADSSSWTKVTRVDFDIIAGDHVLAVRVTNKQGPAALIGALFRPTVPVAEVPKGTVTISVGVLPARVTKTAHGLPLNQKIQFSTTGVLPTGVSAGVDYYVKTILNANEFTFSLTAGGTAVIATAPQSGVHSMFIPTIPSQASLVSVTGTTGWKVNGYPDPIPGWSPGEILLTLMAEAEARGVLSMGWFTPTFTATHDSYGNEWGRELDWTFDVGDTLEDVIEQMEELACDLWIDPDTLELHMAAERGVDRTIYDFDVDGITVLSAPLVFERGKNLIKAEIDGNGSVTNALYMKTADGWITRTDATSLAKYGKLEGKLETGASTAVSIAVADFVFKQRAIPEEGASYTVVPSEGYYPFHDFNVGDWVFAPDNRGISVRRRVVSLSLTEDAAGNPVYTIEFDTIFRDGEDKLLRWLAKAAGGSLGGSSANASPVGSNPIYSPVVPAPGVPVLLVPKSPNGLTATSVGFWNATGTEPYAEITLEWNPVTENTDDSLTIPTFYEVWGHLTSATDSAYQRFASVTDNTAIIRPFETLSEWTFKIRALNSADAVSDWSDEITHVMAEPTIPMDPPSDPLLSSAAGVLIVEWDGLLGLTAPPPQFRYVYALVAPTTGGTGVQLGSVLQRGGGTIAIPGLVVGEDYFVTLIAVDGAGIESAASGEQSTTIVGVLPGDLDDEITDAIEAAHEAARVAKESINLLEDPSFELNTEEYWDLAAANVTNVTTDPRTGLRHLRMEATGTPYEAFHYQRALLCDPGDTFLFRIYAFPEVSAGDDSEEGGLELSIMYGADDTTSSTEVIGSSQDLLAGDYEAVTGSWTAPAGTNYFRPRLMVRDTTADNVYYVDDARLVRMTTTTLLVDGAVIADKIAAESISAVHMQANSIAALSIQAEAITAEKMAADSVTANSIVAGAVTADAISAGAVSTIHLSPSVGGELDITANDSVTIIVGQIEDVTDIANQNSDNFEEMRTYYDFGANGAVISKPGSPFSIALRSDKIEMLENGNVVSYWNSGQLYVTSFIGEKVVLGNHQLEKYSTGTVVRSI